MNFFLLALHFIKNNMGVVSVAQLIMKYIQNKKELEKSDINTPTGCCELHKTLQMSSLSPHLPVIMSPYPCFELLFLLKQCRFVENAFRRRYVCHAMVLRTSITEKQHKMAI